MTLTKEQIADFEARATISDWQDATGLVGVHRGGCEFLGPDEHEAIFTAIAALDATRWRSMDTAPRDGSLVDLAYINTWGNPVAGEARAIVGPGWQSQYSSFIHEPLCLGWRPRPEPPKERI